MKFKDQKSDACIHCNFEQKFNFGEKPLQSKWYLCESHGKQSEAFDD